MTGFSARCYVTHWVVENLSALQGIVWNSKWQRLKSRDEIKCYFTLPGFRCPFDLFRRFWGVFIYLSQLSVDEVNARHCCFERKDFPSLRWRETSSRGFEFRQENGLAVQVFPNTAQCPTLTFFYGKL